MATTIKFGTDGWRGIIADDYTFDNVRRCAQGLANLHLADGSAAKGIVVGYDKRFESEDFAAATAEVLAANGIRVFLCQRSEPTPVISHAILDRHAAGGATITASHNPAIWNGFKVRSDYGGAASPEVVAVLEGYIDRVPAEGARRANLATPEQNGQITLLDPVPAYLAQIQGLVDFNRIRQAGLRIVADAMYGAGMGWYPHLLSGGSTTIIEINGERNPSFGGINPEPISRNLQKLFATVRTTESMVGLATDGDADRLGVCDEHGHFIDQLRVFSLLTLYMLEVRGWRGPIVKTLSTSSMLDRLGEIYNVPVHETGVGFKFVAPKMIETNALIGGEESGGYAFRGHIPERDGILAGLFILDMMVQLNKTPSELVEFLFSKVGPHYYDRLDVHFPATERAVIVNRLSAARPGQIGGVPVVEIQTVDGYKFKLADGSWLLIRFSGTEPVMRIYAETSSLEDVKTLLNAGRALTSA